MARTASITIAAALLLIAAAPAQACPDGGATPPELTVEAAKETVLCMINERRRRNGVRGLRTDSRLESAAQSHSAAMDASDFFSHSGANGSSPVSRIRSSGYLAGAGSWAIAENLRWGEGTEATPRAAVSRWMKSPSHREAMLSRRYREVGIGVVIGSPAGGGENAAIYTVDFGVRR